KYWNHVRPVIHSISTVDSRPFLFPGILPERYYKDEIKQSISLYQDIIEFAQKNEYKHRGKNEERIRQYQDLISQLKGYEKTFIAHENDYKLIQTLKDYLNTNDSRRKCHWKLLWPWLDSIAAENHRVMELA